MSSLKEIAQIAGVDASTVSRALNDSPRVKRETKEMIKKLAKQYNYVPDELARGLVNKKTYTVGIVIPEFMNTFYAEIVEGLESVFSVEGYSMLFGKSDFNLENEIKCLDIFFRKRVDGIICCAVSKGALEHIKKCKRDMPVVMVDPFISCPEFDTVSIDNSYGVQCVIEYLLKLGHKRIGFIGDSIVITERLEAYKKTLEQFRVPVREEYIAVGQERYEHGGYLRMQELLRLEERPTAVFSVTDNMAIGAIHAVREANLNIPGDISIVGFDDIMVSSYLNTPLSTVLQPKYEIGKMSADLLMARMNNTGSKFTQQIVLKPEFVERNTAMRIKQNEFSKS